MGWNDHVDWQLLDDVEEMVSAGILDPESPDDKVLIDAIMAVAGYVDGNLVNATPEQQAEYEKYIGKCMEQLEEERDFEWLEYQISKDD